MTKSLPSVPLIMYVSPSLCVIWPLILSSPTNMNSAPLVSHESDILNVKDFPCKTCFRCEKSRLIEVRGRLCLVGNWERRSGLSFHVHLTPLEYMTDLAYCLSKMMVPSPCMVNLWTISPLRSSNTPTGLSERVKWSIYQSQFIIYSQSQFIYNQSQFIYNQSQFNPPPFKNANEIFVEIAISSADMLISRLSMPVRAYNIIIDIKHHVMLHLFKNKTAPKLSVNQSLTSVVWLYQQRILLFPCPPNKSTIN